MIVKDDEISCIPLWTHEEDNKFTVKGRCLCAWEWHKIYNLFSHDVSGVNKYWFDTIFEYIEMKWMENFLGKYMLSSTRKNCEQLTVKKDESSLSICDDLNVFWHSGEGEIYVGV